MSLFRRHASAMLATVLLFSNGYLFIPWMGVGALRSATAGTVSQCCCSHPDGDMSCPCCRARSSEHSKDRCGCSVSSAPCSMPVVALTSNVLDPAVETIIARGANVVAHAHQKFHIPIPYLLPGLQNLTFHPPQFSSSLS
jgi:hypothetical protein